MTLNMKLGKDIYDIIVERGILENVNKYLHLDRKVLVVTDDGVPEAYAKTVAQKCKVGITYTVPSGEGSKSIDKLGELLGVMLDNGFSRKDAVVAVGGGVVGDLAGFAAAIYMRGIDFYNIPTTLLSQVDSSIGGKTAINFGGVKNPVGAFYQPKRVLIDPELLKTLPDRQLSNGLAEAIKMALTSDRELFELIEGEDIHQNIDEIIIRSLMIKKSVVECDEREGGLRKILNFGHTVGHGIESLFGMSELYHGECVALGMIPTLGEGIRQRVIDTLKKYDLIKKIKYDWEAISRAIQHDKKADSGELTVTLVNEIGSYELKTVSCNELIASAKLALGDIL